MQVYKHMDIGTAKVTRDEMDGIPHHMIDILEPDESFSAYEFKKKQKLVLKILSIGEITYHRWRHRTLHTIFALQLCFRR